MYICLVGVSIPVNNYVPELFTSQALDAPHVWYVLNSVCTHLNEMLSLENLSLVPRFSGTRNVHTWRAWYLFYVSIIIKIGLKEKGNVLRIVQ